MRKVELGSVCEIKNGYAFKSSEFKKSGTPLIRISSFDNGPVYFDDKTVYVDSSYLKTKSGFRVEKGDVLIALSGATTGKYGIYKDDEPSLLNQRIGLLKSGSSEQMIDKFFYYYLSVLKSEILRNAGGAAQPNISTKSISEFKIPLPPLDQQKKIAAILDAADAYRQKTKALIEKYDELTQSLFLDMFGDPVSNPKGWEKKGLSKLGNVVTGSTPPSSKEGMFGGNIPFVTPGDLGHDRPVKRTVTREGAENSRVVRKGSLFLCCIGATIGKKGIARTDSSFNQQINAVEWNELINDYWGLYAFTWLKHEVIERAISTTLPIMKKSEFEKVKVPCPPIYLQSQFAERVQAIEAQKAQAQASLAQAEDLFNSLLQRAFKGELVN